MSDKQPKAWTHEEILKFGETTVDNTVKPSPEVIKERQRTAKLLEAIEFALIFNPYHDQYKIQHEVLPKLKQAKADYEAGL